MTSRLPPQQTIQFVKIESDCVVVTDWDRYEFRPEQGWKWLQRLCFAILRWIGANWAPVVTTFRRLPEENNDILKSLLGQQGQWIAHVHEERDRMRIYMGPDEELELMQLSDFRAMQASTFTGRIETRDRYGARKWHDIPITVVPWMKGALIVPR